MEEMSLLADRSLLDPAREYPLHRRAVSAHLRAEFGTLLTEEDHEELYQDAWLVVTRMLERGEQIHALPALLKQVARWRGRDRLRKESPTPTDPHAETFLALLGDEPSPEDTTVVKVDVDVCQRII